MVVQYLTGYCDYLTGCCEPRSPPYRCHTSFKKWILWSLGHVFSLANVTKNLVKNCCVFFILFLLIGPEILFLFLETASVVRGPFLTAQSASLYSDPVMNWCCDCQPCLTLTVHNLHQTLYTVICQLCLTLTMQSASDSLHCHLSAMSDTDCAQSASDSLHCHLSAMSDTDCAQSASDSLHCHLSAMSDTDCAQSASDSLHCHELMLRLSAMSDTDCVPSVFQVCRPPRKVQNDLWCSTGGG